MADPPGEIGARLPSASSVQKQKHVKNVKKGKASSPTKSSGLQEKQNETQQPTPPPQQQQNSRQQQTSQNQNQQHQQQQIQQQKQRPSKSRKETEEKIEKLLTRLQRQFSAQRPSEQSQTALAFLPRPPDQAASSLGRELADAFLQSMEYPSSDAADFWTLRQRILHCLANRGIHPSIPHAFFGELVMDRNIAKCTSTQTSTGDQDETSWQEWLPDYILQCEQQILDELPNSGGGAYEDAEASGLNETLAAALRAYATFSAFGNKPERSSLLSNNFYIYNQKRRVADEILTVTYRRMQSSAGRTILLREFARSIKELERIPGQLSPLMASCVLTLWATPHAEKTLLLQELYR